MGALCRSQFSGSWFLSVTFFCFLTIHDLYGFLCFEVCIWLHKLRMVIWSQVSYIMTFTTPTVLLVIILASLRVSAQCYNPDGSQASSQYQPCNPDRPSMCCALNRTSAVVNSCRSDNLCADADNNSLWRESCTDPTWKDPACIQLCAEGVTQGLVRHMSKHC